MNRKEFSEAVLSRAYWRCERPLGDGAKCAQPATDAAHIWPSQMGGRKNHDPQNGWAACRECHQWYDDQGAYSVPRPGSARMKRELMAAYFLERRRGTG